MTTERASWAHPRVWQVAAHILARLLYEATPPGRRAARNEAERQRRGRDEVRRR